MDDWGYPYDETETAQDGVGMIVCAAEALGLAHAQVKRRPGGVLLTGAKRRERGEWDEYSIVMTWIIPIHSLRLAPVRLSIPDFSFSATDQISGTI